MTVSVILIFLALQDSGLREVNEISRPALALGQQTERMMVIRMTETVKRLRFTPRSIFCNIFSPETAMKPYSAVQIPPITQLGIELTKATKGAKKEMMIAPTAV